MDRKQENREIMRGGTMDAEMSAVGVGRSWNLLHLHSVKRHADLGDVGFSWSFLNPTLWDSTVTRGPIPYILQ